VQAGKLWQQQLESGCVWIRNDDVFEFSYRFPQKVLDKYIRFKTGQRPSGIFIDFIKKRKDEFQQIFDAVHMKSPAMVPKTSSLSRYAVVKPKTHIGENVLVAQRAYLENSFLGNGANAQENCYIINSRLAGNNVTAHGAKLVHTVWLKMFLSGLTPFYAEPRTVSSTSVRAASSCPTRLSTSGNLWPSRQIIWSGGTSKNRMTSNTTLYH
jgi:NDP-sugar pyrophosphorylase family protein